jgi:neutral ceramidase
MRLSQLSISSGELLEANINRSPTAYMNNPPEERAQYKHDTDKDMTILKIKASGRGRGLLSWFAVHPTSLGNSNTYLSGDNKGLAEQFTERGWGRVQASSKRSSSSKRSKDKSRSSSTSSSSSTSDNTGFVAAFVQPNHGDTSPNIQGTFCGVTRQKCDVTTSTCAGDNQKCLGRGPAWPNDLKSTEVLGMRMANKAEVRGEVEDNWLGKEGIGYGCLSVMVQHMVSA